MTMTAKKTRRVVTRDLIGWKEIADFLGVSVRTAQRWERTSTPPPPIHRTPGGKPEARSDELRGWFTSFGAR